jgi:hypothetical protein
MAAKLKTVTNALRRERIQFLREIAQTLKDPDLYQAVAIFLRKDRSLMTMNLQNRSYAHELIGMFERAKLESWTDVIEARRRRGAI